MKILIIGDANHELINNLVNEIKLYSDCDFIVDILSLTNNLTNFSNSIDKTFNNVYFFPKIENRFLNFPIVRGLYRMIYLNRKAFNVIPSDYDYCHIHYVKYKHVFLLDKIKQHSKKIALSIWGNDYNKSNWIQRQLIHFLFKKASFITCGSEKFIEKIISRNKKISNKIFQANFPRKNLKTIVDLKNIDKYEAKRKLGIPTNSIVITCGYTSKDEQNHIHIIDSLLSIDLPKNHYLLFPMTYGNFHSNISSVKKKLNSTKFKYKIFESFLPSQKIALLRIASDIFINIVPHDSLNSSMLEYLYAKNIMVTGSWLPYGLLDELGIFYQKIENLNDLGDKLKNILTDLENNNSKLISNPKVIEKEFLNEISKRWISLYLNQTV